jgi:hypothetical protein
MLSPSLEPKGFVPSLKSPRNSNGLAIATKMVGANIGSTGDGNPPTGCQEPQNQCLPCLVFIFWTHMSCVVLLGMTIHE